MASKPIPIGPWTKLFGRPTTFEEDSLLAREVGSEIALFDISGAQPELRYVEIVVEDIPGWEEPLWGTDDRWLYLRRPQGVWKTPLPLRHLHRVGVVRQKRAGTTATYGGTQLGVDFANKRSWRIMNAEVEPEDLDWRHGFDQDGTELGPMLFKTVREGQDDVFLLAGPAFGDMPKSCFLDGADIRVQDARGRVVKFTIAPTFDIDALRAYCEAGKLWLRFACYMQQWLDPIDIKVSSRPA